MGFLAILLPITCLVCLVGFIWLVRNAFRTSTGWGLAVLLLSPFGALFFAVRNWQEARKPFLVYTGGVAAGVAVLVMIFGAMGLEAVSMAGEVADGAPTGLQAADPADAQVERMQASAMIVAQGAADADQAPGMADPVGADAAGDVGTEPGVLALAEMADAPGPRVSEVDAEPSEAIVAEVLRLKSMEAARDRQAPIGQIGVSDADRYVGSRMAALGTDGIRHTGKLERADGNALWLEKDFSGGTFSVELKKSQIRSLEILGN